MKFIVECKPKQKKKKHKHTTLSYILFLTVALIENELDWIPRSKLRRIKIEYKKVSSSHNNYCHCMYVCKTHLLVHQESSETENSKNLYIAATRKNIKKPQNINNNNQTNEKKKEAKKNENKNVDKFL